MQVQSVDNVKGVDYSDPFAFKPFKFNSLNPVQGRGSPLGRIPFYELMFDNLGSPQTAYFSPVHTTPHIRPEYRMDPDSPAGATRKRMRGVVAVVQTLWSSNQGWSLARDDYRKWHDEAPEKIGKAEAMALRAEHLGKSVEQLTQNPEKAKAFEREAFEWAPTKAFIIKAWENVQKWHDAVLDPQTRFMEARKKFPDEWIPPNVRERWALRSDAIREGTWSPE